jgi:hypothetical protein
MSTIKLGDKVRFVNENLEGIVTRIEGSTAGVTIEDDFEIPVPLSQIVKISGTQNRSSTEEPTDQKPIIPIQNKGIYIAFDRVTDVLLYLKLYNGSSEQLLFSFYEEIPKQGFRLKKAGMLDFSQTVELGTYDLEKFSQWGIFHFQLLQVNRHNEKLPAPINKQIHLHAKEFHSAYKQTFFLNKQSYLFQIDADALQLIDLNRLKQKDFSETKQTDIHFDRKPEAVIDLHIEKLTENHSDLSPAEMIAAQMEAFTSSLEMAHIHKMKSIIFIHGVGNHFLKNKIKNYLGTQKQLVTSYRDADMLKYGGGATEVFLN